jgi:isoaspartyl peptidase/L-asparaginase-like protein (Ntn-hydrolase superfamily)
MLELCAEGESLLRKGAHSVDVVEAMCVEMEESGLYVAGRGAGPNLAGYFELDASIMTCDAASNDPLCSRRAGAIAAVPHLRNPIRAARAIMDETPHLLLAGRGAENFCRTREFAFIESPDDYYVVPVGLTDEELRSYGHGTVGAVALDSRGRLAAASSTGGTLGKLEGRLGDTPLIGAGSWADENIAGSVTGHGELAILAGGLHSVAGQVRYQRASITQAATNFVQDVLRLGDGAGVIVVSRTGDLAFAWSTDGMKRAGVGPGQPLFSATF